MKPVFSGNEKVLEVDEAGKAVLEEISSFLTAPTIDHTHENQFLLENLPPLFAYGIVLPMKNVLWEPEARDMSDKEKKELLAKTEVVKMFRLCVGKQLNEVLDLSVRQVSRRKQLLKILASLLVAVRSNSGWDQLTLFRQILFEDPFKDQLKILRKDATLVRGVVEEGYTGRY